MRKFFVGNSCNTTYKTINVGIAPGRFDTKQLILSALAVLAYATTDVNIRFVRSVNKEQLAGCQVFINDDFTTMFPVIPSFHDIESTWDNNAKDILKAYAVLNDEEVLKIGKSVKTKICNLESIDCLMEMYEVLHKNVDCFEDALSLTLSLIEKFVKDSIDELMFFFTVKAYTDTLTDNYITLPLYIQGWRNIVRELGAHNSVEYAVFPEGNDAYLIESYDKDMVMKKHVKGMHGLLYSGRFFVKVTDLETAKHVLAKLPRRVNKKAENYA